MTDTSDQPRNVSAKRACIILAAAMVLCGAVLAIVALSLGPPIGDLTRIAGLSERSYGWQRTGSHYTKDHFDKRPLAGLIAEGSGGGVLVFGDSFTDAEQPGTSWLNTLHAQTGEPIDFVEYGTLADVLDVMAAPSVKARPPKAIIIQMGERTVFRRALPLMDRANCAMPAAPQAMDVRPVTLASEPWVRRSRFDSFDELMSWGALATRRRVLSSSKTVAVGLSRGDMFTSARGQELLIYQSDITRHEASALFPMTPAEAQEGIICALRHVMNAADDGTQVYALVAPDKRSVYAPWITDSLPPKALDILGGLPGQFNGRFIEVFKTLRADVEQGRKDVYFPNDTHWNDATAQKVGIMAAERLKFGDY